MDKEAAFRDFCMSADKVQEIKERHKAELAKAKREYEIARDVFIVASKNED